MWAKLKAPRMDPLGSGSRFKPHLLSKDTPSDAMKLLVKLITPFKSDTVHSTQESITLLFSQIFFYITAGMPIAFFNL